MGLALLSQVRQVFPGARIVALTDTTEKRLAVKALRLGAFSFREKPLEEEIVFHAICRALDTSEKERRFKTLLDELQYSRSEIITHKMQLDALNRQLAETKKTLTISIQNREREREQVARAVAFKTRMQVIPVLNKLRRDKGLAKYHSELDMLTNRIMDDLCSISATDALVASVLSSTELRIASMIKNGLTTEEIADQLHISVSTVRTHRKNIRKKLKINNGPYSLKNFLLSGHTVGLEALKGLKEYPHLDHQEKIEDARDGGHTARVRKLLPESIASKHHHPPMPLKRLHRPYWHVVLIFCAALLAFFPFTSVHSWTGKVTGLPTCGELTVSGDHGEEHIRLYGMECPDGGKEFRIWRKSAPSASGPERIPFLPGNGESGACWRFSARAPEKGPEQGIQGIIRV